jgi:hypothetical protein
MSLPRWSGLRETLLGRPSDHGEVLVVQVGLGVSHPVADKGVLLAENECVVDALYLVECVLFSSSSPPYVLE